MNLKYMKVSLFEITYKTKLTFSRHSNLLRCTCRLGAVLGVLQDRFENLLNSIYFLHTCIYSLYTHTYYIDTSITFLDTIIGKLLVIIQ